MLRKFFVILCLCLISFDSNLLAQPALNEPERAKQIARQMIDRNDGRTAYREVQLLTCKYSKKSGSWSCRSNPIKKSIESLRIDVGGNLKDTIGLAIINDPPSEKNMAFLQHDYDAEGKESDQWMYFPAMKKLKRIISQSADSPKTGSVFGSEISYEDIEKMHVSNYRYSYEGNEKIDNRPCDRIVALPTKRQGPKTSYGKEIYWIDQKTKIPLKRDLYDKRGQLVKTFYCKNIIKASGVWMFKVRVVVNHKSGRMTMERTNKMAVNVPMEKELVGLRSLNDASYRESKMNGIRNQAK